MLKRQRKPDLLEQIRSKYGGDEEDRTLDLTDANRTLSQLSYAPENVSIIAPGSRFVQREFQFLKKKIPGIILYFLSKLPIQPY